VEWDTDDPNYFRDKHHIIVHSFITLAYVYLREYNNVFFIFEPPVGLLHQQPAAAAEMTACMT